MSAIGTLIGILKGGSEIAVLVEGATSIVTAAMKLAKETKPVIDSIDTDAAAQAAKEVVDEAAKHAAEAAEAAKQAGDAAGNVFTAMVNKVDGSREAVVRTIQSAKDAQSLKKLIHDAKQAVLENATITMSVRDFLKHRKVPMAFDAMDMPGCFAIATYGPVKLGKDLTGYTGIYVGKADRVGKGVELAISKHGNPDVYADVKYRQNVHVFIYNCMPEVLDERYDALIQALEADKSYNEE